MHIVLFEIYFTFLLFIIKVSNGQEGDNSDNDTSDAEKEEIEEKRRRLRILLFPRGSSLQLVYCFTVPTVNMPNIFVLGVTGSIAWELPYDPAEAYRKRAELLHRRIDRPISSNGMTQETHFPLKPSTNNRKIFYQHRKKNYSTILPRIIVTNSSLKYSEKYKNEQPSDYSNNGNYNTWWNKFKKSDVNPWKSNKSYNKKAHVRDDTYSSYYTRWDSYGNRRKNLYYRKMYPRYGHNLYDDSKSDYHHPIYNEFHRRSRRELYDKIVKALDALRMHGRDCVSKAICQISKIPDGNGSFMQEILKRVFRNKPSYYSHDEDEYDKAANKTHICEEKYKLCANLL